VPDESIAAMGKVRDTVIFLFSKLWKWEVVAWGSAVIYGAGAAALFGDEYIIAAVLFFAAISWLTAKLISWEETRNHSAKRILGGTFLLFGIAAFSISLLWINHRRNDATIHGNAPPKPAEILPVYSLGGSISWALLAHTPLDGPIMLVVRGQVLNFGDPTLLQGWQVFIKPEGSNPVEGVIQAPEEVDQAIPLSATAKMTYSKGPSWVSVTTSRALQKGDVVAGGFISTFPMLSRRELDRLPPVQAVVSFADASGKRYFLGSGPLKPATIRQPGQTSEKPCPSGTIKIDDFHAYGVTNAITTRGKVPCLSIGSLTVVDGKNGLNVNPLPETKTPTPPL
jgi:hypothetical protein